MLLEVEMSKKCTPVFFEAHLEVKSWWVRRTLGNWDVEKVHALAERSTFPSQHVRSTPGSEHLGRLSALPSQKCKTLKCSEHVLTFRCRSVWQAQRILNLAISGQNVSVFYQFQLMLHYTTLRYTTLHYTTLSVQLQLPLPYATLHYATLHCTTLCYTTRH